jgi:asparagine synthase (glutamine-hydrolysing)
MCGIVAIIGREGQEAPLAAVEAASAALEHRGPDDAGISVSGDVALGFRRLAIIDTTPAGHQPMTSADGQLTVVFNGEIYNYIEVRSELIALGHHFATSSDTEVLLASYSQWGADCVHRFNGMWAFVVHDRRTGTLFGARDRLGVKPLYLWHSDEWLVLASEPRAIGASRLTTLQPDWARLADFIAYGLMDHGGHSCFSGIDQVAAGHRFWIDGAGAMKTEAFWRLPAEQPASERRQADWVEELGELAADAVRLRLRSDVPVGFTLSGGIDSTLLICEAAHLRSNQDGLVAFSYQDSRYDELRQINDTVAQTGARLITISDTELDAAALLPEIVHAHGEPLHSMTAMANYALFGLAKQHGIKVVIGGQGADEVLGGYSSFQQDYWHSLVSDSRWAVLARDVQAFSKLHDRSRVATLASTLLRSLRIAASGLHVYRRLADFAAGGPRDTVTTRLFTPELLARSTRPRPVPGDYRLGAVQRSALSYWPLPLYLRVEDRSSMAHSVEARLPFTDYRLVEHALSMPDELKHAGGLNKVGLRSAAARRIPHSVASRVQKFGFPVSANGARARSLHARCRDMAASREFRERGIYHLPAVDKLLDDIDLGSESHINAIFDLMQIELWLREVDPASPAAPMR